MSYDEIYEEISPYLSDPKGIREFLDKHKECSVDELIEKINELMADSNTPLRTDLRILLNAILKKDRW